MAPHRPIRAAVERRWLFAVVTLGPPRWITSVLAGLSIRELLSEQDLGRDTVGLLVPPTHQPVTPHRRTPLHYYLVLTKPDFNSSQSGSHQSQVPRVTKSQSCPIVGLSIPGVQSVVGYADFLNKFGTLRSDQAQQKKLELITMSPLSVGSIQILNLPPFYSNHRENMLDPLAPNGFGTSLKF